MANEHEVKKGIRPAEPPAHDPAGRPMDVELTDDELDKVSGGISSELPVRPGTPIPPGP
jgi:bacteriocin-like protein